MDERSQPTLGCDCATPAPESPGSALCAQCGLIHLTSEQYAAHLERCRAEVAALLEQPQPEAAKAEDTPAEDLPEREPRQWFKRRRSRVAAPVA